MHQRINVRGGAMVNFYGKRLHQFVAHAEHGLVQKLLWAECAAKIGLFRNCAWTITVHA
jgi:hypothetical protein